MGFVLTRNYYWFVICLILFCVICVERNWNCSFQGNCPLKEQLPTLRLLLDFMKCLFLKSSDTKSNEKESIDDILNVCKQIHLKYILFVYDFVYL